MLIKEDVEIPYLHQMRKLHIFIPDNAQEGERFPVFYMFDGHNLFLDEDAKLISTKFNYNGEDKCLKGKFFDKNYIYTKLKNNPDIIDIELQSEK